MFEAARQWGGRARALPATLPDGTPLLLDNGQHIMLGAYAQTLARLARIDPQLLFPVRHRSAKAQEDLTVIRARAGLERAAN